MPFQSEAQRKFLFAKHPKIAEEFAEATPKGADLPEHVKKPMADGGVAQDPRKEGDEFTDALKQGINHDSDAVKSYLASKFQGLISPMSDTDQVAKQAGGPTADEQAENVKRQAATGMSEGGYPHVTFMENMPQEQVEKTVHLEKSPDPEPAKAQASEEEKMSSIYKAMGVKKYADGGEVQPPVGPAIGNTPNPNDPTYWDQIKAALAKVSAPITGLANAATAPVESAAKMATPLVPAAAAALNTLTGASIPIPQVSAPETQPLGAPVPLSAPTPPISAPVAPPVAPSIGKGTPAPDLKNIFNQDTSALTQGVDAGDRQQVADKQLAGQRGLGSMVAEAIAGFGDSLAAKGGREQHALKDIFSMQKQQRDEALSNFDKARQARLEKLDLQTKMGNNALNQLAAQDAYGSDEHLNKQLGAPPGTLHKDLPLYMQMMSAKIAQQEKDTDLYMKAHAQAATEVDGALKNAGMFNMKPSPAQIQASGAKLADQYYNRAKGNILFQPSDGQKPVWLPAQNASKAKQMDPNGQIVP